MKKEAIIGIRVQQVVKELLKGTATGQGQTLSAFLSELIWAGWLVKQDTWKKAREDDLLNSKNSVDNRLDKRTGARESLQRR